MTTHTFTARHRLAYVANADALRLANAHAAEHGGLVLPPSAGRIGGEWVSVCVVIGEES